MPRVELSRAATEDLERLIRSHALPADTVPRLQRCLRPLERFPLIGPALGGQWAGMRFILGPWRWMLCIYFVLEEEDRVVVLTIQDARAERGPS